MDSMMTRRGFLAAGASCAALAAIGTSTGCSSSQTEPLSSDASVTYTKATLCAGCANKCGIEAWVRGGKLWRFMGAEAIRILADICAAVARACLRSRLPKIA